VDDVDREGVPIDLCVELLGLLKPPFLSPHIPPSLKPPETLVLPILQSTPQNTSPG
jgi:hypothetical protein